MTPTNKGNYSFCIDCKYRLNEGKYPCIRSHKEVRGKVDYERNFIICMLKEK